MFLKISPQYYKTQLYSYFASVWTLNTMNIVRFRFESLSFASCLRVKIDGYTLYIHAYIYFAHGA